MGMNYVIPRNRTYIEPAHQHHMARPSHSKQSIEINSFRYLSLSRIICTRVIHSTMSNPQLLDIEPGGENTQYAISISTNISGILR